MTSIKIVLGGKALSEGTRAVYLQIIKNRKRKLIALGLRCKESDFANQEFKKTHPNHMKRNHLLNIIKTKAYEIIDVFMLKKVNYTLNDFEAKFREKPTSNSGTVAEFCQEIIDEQLKSGRISNAKTYRDTKVSLSKYAKPNLRFEDVTVAFLEKYEAYLRSENNQDGGISVKMRTLRALYNKAITRKIVGLGDYPFREYKISKLKPKPVKRALTLDEFKRIKELDLSGKEHLLDTYNIFMFSFYTRGMNYVDIMKLRWSNIVGDTIIYNRSKTKGKFLIKILPLVRGILDYYKAQPTISGYIFPILMRDGMTPLQISYRKQKMLKVYNDQLKELAALAGVDKVLTSYVARHSYATIMKGMGVATDLISESMGHADLKVTQAYLKEFENEVIDNANDKLLDI